MNMASRIYWTARRADDRSVAASIPRKSRVSIAIHLSTLQLLALTFGHNTIYLIKSLLKKDKRFSIFHLKWYCVIR